MLVACGLLVGCSALLDLDGFEYDDAAVADAGRDAFDEDADVDDDAGADAAGDDAGSDASEDAPPDAGRPTFLDYRAGMFSRGSEASWLTRTPAGGVAVNWAAPNERRFQVPFGSGEDAQLLLEGTGRNRAPLIVGTLADPPWDYEMTPDPTLVTRVAPDGSVADGYVNLVGAPNRPRYLPGDMGTDWTVSIFVHRGMGDTNLVLRGPPRPPATTVIDDRPTGWKRYSATWSGESLAYQIQIANGQDIGAGMTGVVGDFHYWWGPQIEDGLFPTSFIRAPSGAREHDQLAFTEDEASAILGDFELDVWPSFASTEMPADQSFVLFSLGGGSEVLRLINGHLEYVVAGSVACRTTDPVEFARGEQLHVVIEHGVQIQIRGAAFGPWIEDAPTWFPGFEFLRVGAVHFDGAAIDAWFGLIGEPTTL